MSTRTMSDAEALDLIRDTIAANLSTGKMLTDITEAVEQTGRTVDDE